MKIFAFGQKVCRFLARGNVSLYPVFDKTTGNHRANSPGTAGYHGDFSLHIEQ